MQMLDIGLVRCPPICENILFDNNEDFFITITGRSTGFNAAVILVYR